MRSVLYSAYQVPSLLYRDLLTDLAPFKAALNAFIAEERALQEPWEPNRFYEPSSGF
jgi:hypothetical protein